MRRRSVLYASLLGLVFLGLLAVADFMPLSPERLPAPDTTSSKPVQPLKALQPAKIQTLIRQSERADPGPLPRSLAGTQAPGGWQRVEDGQLVPTPQLRELFEYYLSALGEEPLQTIVARIRAALAVLPPAARQQALEILGHYLDYRLALTQLGSGEQGSVGLSGDPDAIAAQLAKVRDLRRQTLGEDVADAFFARDEALDQYTLTRLRIERDDSLSAAQKKAQLAAAATQLPESMQASRAATERFADYQQSLQKLRSEGASAAQIDQLRQQTFGAEAAQRLAALDQQRADWQKRWQAYRNAVAQLDASGLASDEKVQQQAQLRQQYFSASELPRVKALDSIQKAAGSKP